jgi:hypothetical protein
MLDHLRLVNLDLVPQVRARSLGANLGPLARVTDVRSIDQESR